MIYKQKKNVIGRYLILNKDLTKFLIFYDRYLISSIKSIFEI